jgi:hypothetical protein
MARGAATIPCRRHRSALNAEPSHAAKLGTRFPRIGAARHPAARFGWLPPVLAHAIAIAVCSKQKRKERKWTQMNANGSVPLLARRRSSAVTIARRRARCGICGRAAMQRAGAL